MPLERRLFGTTADGSVVEALTLENTSAGVSVTLITYGARIIDLQLPDRSGERDNVVLGFDRLEPYLEDRTSYFGPVVGRYAKPDRRRAVRAGRRDVRAAEERPRGPEHAPRRAARVRQADLAGRGMRRRRVSLRPAQL
jgi:aldose 1-epimerase